jgi:pyruvate dehydrogenase E2 component (dihydrolipoamide acetyltransferase)
LISEIIIPNLGATGGAVTFEEWRVEPGGFVEAGAPIFVVTTDKATVEVEAFATGYLRKAFASAGDQFESGDIVGLLSETPDEAVEGETTAGATKITKLDPGSEEALPEVLPNDQVGKASRILASPLAWRMAKQSGLDLAGVAGSGRRGEILRRDIERILVAEMSPGSSASQAGQPAQAETIPLSGMRRAIAERTQASKSQIPHFYASITIDMEAARSFLESASRFAAKNNWQPPTLTDLILYATALTLREYPQINASFNAGAISIHPDVNIGLVVGLEEGLIIPVVHQVDEKNLYAIAALTGRLKDGALNGALRGSDLSGSTFTLSNLGMYGLDKFIAVINPPEAGVLAVGAVRQLPAVWKGTIVPRWQMEVMLSVDHRIVDGVVAARFLAALKERLEEPVSLILSGPEVDR